MNYKGVHELLSNTLNEDVTYSAQPLEMRNQRTYAIKVRVYMKKLKAQY